MERVKEILKRKRLEKGYTLRDAERVTGVSIVSINNYEKGRLPTGSKLKKLCYAYGIPWEDISSQWVAERLERKSNENYK